MFCLSLVPLTPFFARLHTLEFRHSIFICERYPCKRWGFTVLPWNIITELHNCILYTVQVHTWKLSNGNNRDQYFGGTSNQLRGTVTQLWAGWPVNIVLILGTGKTFFFSPKCPDDLWNSTSLFSLSTRSNCPGYRTACLWTFSSTALVIKFYLNFPTYLHCEWGRTRPFT
jgi:hypothetical protein